MFASLIAFFPKKRVGPSASATMENSMCGYGLQLREANKLRTNVYVFARWAAWFPKHVQKLACLCSLSYSKNETWMLWKLQQSCLFQFQSCFLDWAVFLLVVLETKAFPLCKVNFRCLAQEVTVVQNWPKCLVVTWKQLLPLWWPYTMSKHFAVVYCWGKQAAWFSPHTGAWHIKMSLTPYM